MICDWLSPGDSRWPEALGRVRHDVYHLPAYALHAAKHEGGTPLAFYAQHGDDFLFVPVLVRPLPETVAKTKDGCDASSPYGYPGPLCKCGASSRLEAFLAALIESASDFQISSLFLRMNPLLPLPSQRFHSGIDFVAHGPTVYVDLSERDEQLAASVRPGHRYEIRRLIKEGFQVVMNDWNMYPDFMKTYTATMNRLSAGDRYYFSDEYFWDLKQQLGRRLHLGCVSAPGDQFVAGSLFTECSGIVQYHLSATDDAFRRKSPTKLLLQHIVAWAKQRGNQYVHLGGGLGAQEDSLFRFKAGFSKSRATFSTMRIVVDVEEYARLMQRWREQMPFTEPRANFFPGYRQPADPLANRVA